MNNLYYKWKSAVLYISHFVGHYQQSIETVGNLNQKLRTNTLKFYRKQYVTGPE